MEHKFISQKLLLDIIHLLAPEGFKARTFSI